MKDDGTRESNMGLANTTTQLKCQTGSGWFGSVCWKTGSELSGFQFEESLTVYGTKGHLVLKNDICTVYDENRNILTQFDRHKFSRKHEII
jgi:hypothetical protein